MSEDVAEKKTLNDSNMAHIVESFTENTVTHTLRDAVRGKMSTNRCVP